MSECNSRERKASCPPNNKKTRLLEPFRIMLLLVFVILIATISLWTLSDNSQAGARVRKVLPGQMMKVLDKNHMSRVVEIPSVSRPGFVGETDRQPEFGTGFYGGRPVKFEERNGWAIVDGDIIIGRASDMADAQNAIGIAQTDHMWPKVGGVFQVPYVITSGNANVPTAIGYVNSTFAGVIQWVPRTSETDYVNFNFDPNDHSGSGESAAGRAGGAQDLAGSIDMNVETLLHEMGHAYGLLHEQSRSDRDAYIEFHPENMSDAYRQSSYSLPDYFQLDADIQNIGLYDYASVMHYYWNNFAKNEGPVFETIPHGMQIAQYPASASTGNYSEGDIDAIKRIYDSTPYPVTITSSPPGLQVIVDGNTITTPQTFSWPLYSTHTLSIPTGGQTVSGRSYVYGRWNDDINATHTITIAGGDGSRTSPRDHPAITVYSANFINLIKFTQDVYPAGAGTMTATPAPLSYPGLIGSYYVARQPVTLQAFPNAGQSFYAWFNTPVYSFSKNPETFRWDLDLANAEVNAQAGFTDQPAYTFTASATDRRIWEYVDGGFYYAPVIFSPFYDGSGWAPGTTHSVSTDAVQYPIDYGTRHQFQSWSDSGAQTHNVTLAAGNNTYTANFTPQFRALVDSPCGGTPSITPFSADQFYDGGTSLTVSQSPSPGFVFTGWKEDLTGTTSPQIFPINDEFYSYAKYNVNSIPFSVTGLSPSSVLAGSAGFTLTINGTGFTNDQTSVFVNNSFRANTFVNSSQITVPIDSSDLAVAGAISIFVQNYPTVGASCAVYFNSVLTIKQTAPSAAEVYIAGRVTNVSGNGIAGASIRLSGADGNTRSTITGPFGYFRFDGVEAGRTYILSVEHKRYRFELPTRAITVNDNVTDSDFVSLP